MRVAEVIVLNIDGDAFAIADVDAEAVPGDEDHLLVDAEKDVRILLDVDTTTPGVYRAEMDIMLEDAFDCGVRVAMRIQVLDPDPDPDDLDGDGWTLADGDCQNDNPWTSPGTLEVCDGTDNDCDGDIDENGCESSRIACPEEPRACGCASSPGGGAWLGVFALLARRRRAGSR